MNIFQKLNAARKEFHSLKLKKSGQNKFAGYEYFELADFLIPALTVFEKHGLCAVISFDKDVATMTIYTSIGENGSYSNITITSPMGSANLKGCHEVQNIGAVETYQRRYLWMAALEIVEHDALDASTGSEKKSDPWADFTVQQKAKLREAGQRAITSYLEGKEWAAWEEYSTMLDKASNSEIRNQMKLCFWEVFTNQSALRTYLTTCEDQLKDNK